MNADQLIECILAEKAGKKVEYTYKGQNNWHRKTPKEWNTQAFDYRIAKEPRVFWCGMNRANEVLFLRPTKAEAEREVLKANNERHYGPYILCRVEEILE